MQQANVTEAAVIVKSYRSVIVAYTTESRARGLGERESGERGPWESVKDRQTLLLASVYVRPSPPR